MKRRFSHALILFACLILGLAVLASTVPRAAAQDIQVTSADPPEAPQGTINLNVSIKGKGFKKGAVSQFLVSGTSDPGGVTVKSTTFKGPSELIANIDIADTAVLAKFDIVVRNSDGRTGKGTELFRVTEKTTGNQSCPAPAPALTGPTSCAAGSTAPGCLDENFGSGGVVITDTSGPFPVLTDLDIAMAAAIQPDGKVVVAGWSRKLDNSGDETAILRYNADGSPDPTFGGGGTARVGMAYLYDMALQPDGRILLAGFGFAVIRLNADGSLDTSFGNGGVASTTFSGRGNRTWGLAQAVALQDDGKILVAGEGAETKGGAVTWGIARFNPDGSLDTGFGTSGKVSPPTSGGRAYAIAFQDVPVGASIEKRILVGGEAASNPGQPGDFALMRLTMSGALDTSFGSNSDGKAVKEVCGGTDRVRGLAVDANGNIIAGGQASIGSDPDGFPNWYFTLARFTSSGLPDNAFGDGIAQRPGTSVVDLLDPGNNTVRGFAIQADGKILLSGTASKQFGLVRFNPDGTLDTTFGTGGAVATNVSDIADNFANRLVLQPDGKIVVAGSAAVNNTYNFAVVRYWH